MSDAAVLIPNVPMTEEMRRIGREQAIRTSHMLAVRKLEQALETRARADIAVKEAVQQLDKVLERALAHGVVPLSEEPNNNA